MCFTKPQWGNIRMFNLPIVPCLWCTSIFIVTGFCWSLHASTLFLWKQILSQRWNVNCCRAMIFCRLPSLIRYVNLWILNSLGRVTHICVSKLTIIGSDNGLSPRRRQAIIWTDAGILLIGPLGTSFSEISIEIRTLLLKKMHLKMSSGKWRPFCLGLNVLTHWGRMTHNMRLWSNHH